VGRQAAGAVRAVDRHDLGADRGRFGDHGRHDAEEGACRGFQDRAQRLLHAAGRELDERRFHDVDQGVHGEDGADVGFGEEDGHRAVSLYLHPRSTDILRGFATPCTA